MTKKFVLCIFFFLAFLSSSPFEEGTPLDLLEDTDEIVYSPTMFTGTQYLNTAWFASYTLASKLYRVLSPHEQS